MRLSTAQIQQRGLNGILERTSDLSHTQQQLATGKRILTPSDDVFATTQAYAVKQVIATHEQFQVNAGYAEGRLNQEEIVLNHAIDILQRVHELGVQANNTSYGALERKNISIEVRVMLDELVNIANSTDSNGEYLFSGLQVDTLTVEESPAGSGTYVYTAGDTGRRSVQIGVSSQVTVGDPGSEVFFDVPRSAGANQSIFATIEQFAQDLETNTNLPSSVTLADLRLAIDHIGTYRASVGARQSMIEGINQLNIDIVLQGQVTLSDLQDLDFAEAVSRLNLQMVGLEASQQSFNKIQNLSLFNYL